MIAHELNPEWYRKPVAITNACRQFLSHRRSAISKITGKPVKEVTVISDYTVVRYYLNRLQKAKKLPSELSVKFVDPMPSQYTARSIVMN
ncbi:hypothetical protein [Pseudomonas anguilliseptica]|uniref:hypothetical protein n=1 Tax=Pseudomonas anguilliseptica TaxID=53406 RepID=UPI00325A7DEF